MQHMFISKNMLHISIHNRQKRTIQFSKQLLERRYTGNSHKIAAGLTPHFGEDSTE